MLIQRIRELAEYLSHGKRDPDDIARFLALRTFEGFETLTIFMTLVRDQSSLQHVGSYGYPASVIQNWNQVPLHLELPITHSFRNSAIVHHSSKDEITIEFPVFGDFKEFTEGWKTALAWPINTEGSVFAFFKKEVAINQETKIFFYSVGSLLGLGLKGCFRCDRVEDASRGQVADGVNQLTNRQEVILELVRNGLTNREVSSQLGYSESLIKKECIQIFKLLKVKSRTELIEVNS